MSGSTSQCAQKRKNCFSEVCARNYEAQLEKKQDEHDWTRNESQAVFRCSYVPHNKTIITNDIRDILH